MDICFIADAAHVNTWNWVEYFAKDLAHNVTVVSFNTPRKKTEAIRSYTIDGIYATSKLKYMICVPLVKRIVKSIKPDLVIGYRIHSYGFTAAAIGIHPLVLAGQGQNIYYPFDSCIAEYCAKFAIRHADLINSWGKHMTDKLVELGCPPERILTLPRGVRTDLFKREACSFGTREQICLISTRGLKENYNIETLIKACKIIKESGLKFKLTLAGEGPHRDLLEQMARDLGVSSEVHFVGHVSNDKLPDLLNQGDIYLSMVSTDGVSASLLEAMACGLFPIVTDNIANRLWIRDGQNGFLVPERNVEILVKRILFAVSQEGLRKRAAEENRRIVERKADWKTNMKIIENAYAELVSKRKSHA